MAMFFPSGIFSISDERHFNRIALEHFRYQLQENPVFREFTEALGIDPGEVKHYTEIPFLPVEFFKTHRITATKRKPELIFKSSGTTGTTRSIHQVADASLYRDTLIASFRYFYGEPGKYMILALTPSPIENPESSLTYMIRTWMDAGSNEGSGFYLHRQDHLAKFLEKMMVDSFAPKSPEGDLSKAEIRNSNVEPRTSNLKDPTVLLIGLTYALLDFAEHHPIPLSGSIIMETGGMKGRKKEMIKEEVHELLQQAFRVPCIHSEYGMTELLSQAYSEGKGIFRCPPWMKVMIRDVNDPLSWIGPGRTGGISIIDLANKYSCPFIATQDLGRIYDDGSFEILGRFDYSDARGCSLMIPPV